MSNFKFGKRSNNNLYGDTSKPGVHPKVAELCVLALKYSTVDFGVIDGVRTIEQQQEYFKNGKSELDGVTKVSDHQRRLAIDIFPSGIKDGLRLNMWDVSDPDVIVVWLEVYRAFMRASMRLGLVLEFGLGYNISGGRDYPHISIKGLKPNDYSGMSNLT